MGRDREFADSVVLVTGAGGGIGRAIAQAFGAAGARLVLAGRNTAMLDSAKEAVEAAGGQAITVPTDVTSRAAVEAMVASAVRHYGRLDIAINNAGTLAPTALTADCEEADWDRTIAVNLKGVWLCMKYEIPEMLKAGGGRIVNISSAGGLIGSPLFSPYVASKHAVLGLTKTAAVEYAKQGIRINAVCPSFIRTPMIEQSIADTPGMTEALAGGAHPIGRIGEAEEVAGAVLFLCSGAASFVVGAALPIDGGFTVV